MKLFGCWHTWFSFKGNVAEIGFSNQDFKFVITPMVCIKCSEVRWKYVNGNIAGNIAGRWK